MSVIPSINFLESIPSFFEVKNIKEIGDLLRQCAKFGSNRITIYLFMKDWEKQKIIEVVRELDKQGYRVDYMEFEDYWSLEIRWS